MAFLLVGFLLTDSEGVKIGKSGKRMDRADHIDSSEDYEDPRSNEEEEKDKKISRKSYFPIKSKEQNKDFFKGFNAKDFDSTEFVGMIDDDGLKRRKSTFDWSDDDEYDFPDFKDFPEEPRESPSGYSPHVSMQEGYTGGPFNHQYSITHPRTPSKKSFEFDDFDFNSKEAEGAYSSNIQTPAPSNFENKKGKQNYGPLLVMPRTRHQLPEKFSLSSDFTNNVPRKIKYEPQKLIVNGTNCFKTRKKMKLSSERISICYKCFDDDNEKTFERCSYESEPREKTVTYESRVHSHKSDAPRSRTKREIFPEDSGEVGFGFGEFNLGSDSAEFFGPEFDDVDDPDRRRSGSKDKPSFSDSASGRSCLKTKKNNMVCIRCMDPSTNGLSEQCSYESDPVENTYRYSAKNTYGTPTDPKIHYPDRFKRSSLHYVVRNKRNIKQSYRQANSTAGIKSQKPTVVLKDFQENKPIGRPRPLQSTSSSLRKNKIRTPTDIINFNFFTRLFNKSNSDTSDGEFDVAKAVNALTDATVDRDGDEPASVFILEDSKEDDYSLNGGNYRQLIGEFVSKDWENCTLKMKGNLTCYVCNDKTSFHEECLHVGRTEQPDNENINYKRPFLNKFYPKKFAGQKTEPIIDSKSKRIPRSVFDRNFDDSTESFFKANDKFKERRYESDISFDDSETPIANDEYDPEHESRGGKYSSWDHDVPFF